MGINIFEFTTHPKTAATIKEKYSSAAQVMQRFRNSLEHTFCDMTHYCTVCGVALDMAEQSGIECNDGVVGISHIVRAQTYEYLLEDTVPDYGCSDVEPEPA